MATALLGGLEIPEIARAFLVPEATMAQRIVRAKRKIRNARIPAGSRSFPGLLTPVIAVVYLMFGESSAATDGLLLRLDMCAEAIRLARVVTELTPHEPEAQGLPALLLLLHTRNAAQSPPTVRWFAWPTRTAAPSKDRNASKPRAPRVPALMIMANRR